VILNLRDNLIIILLTFFLNPVKI